MIAQAIIPRHDRVQRAISEPHDTRCHTQTRPHLHVAELLRTRHHLGAGICVLIGEVVANAGMPGASGRSPDRFSPCRQFHSVPVVAAMVTGDG